MVASWSRMKDVVASTRGLPRLHLFEFNDSPWAPQWLRESIVRALSEANRLGGLVDGVVGPLTRCLERTGTNEVLELCSGAGGPAEILLEALHRVHPKARLVLSDLFPMIREWERLRERHPQSLSYIEAPLDAMAIPPALAQGRVAMLVNGLHHFTPPEAQRLLRSVCAHAQGLFIAEGLIRNPLSFVAMAPMGLAGLATSLNRAEGNNSERWLRRLSAPVTLAAGAWDGLVSSMRMYQLSELREMVRGLDGWSWHGDQYRHSQGWGRGSWFYGTRC